MHILTYVQLLVLCIFLALLPTTSSSTHYSVTFTFTLSQRPETHIYSGTSHLTFSSEIDESSQQRVTSSSARVPVVTLTQLQTHLSKTTVEAEEGEEGEPENSDHHLFELFYDTGRLLLGRTTTTTTSTTSNSNSNSNSNSEFHSICSHSVPPVPDFWHLISEMRMRIGRMSTELLFDDALNELCLGRGLLFGEVWYADEWYGVCFEKNDEKNENESQRSQVILDFLGRVRLIVEKNFVLEVESMRILSGEKEEFESIFSQEIRSQIVNNCPKSQWMDSVSSASTLPWYRDSSSCRFDWLNNPSSSVVDHPCEEVQFPGWGLGQQGFEEGKKDCLFVHGIGQRENSPPTTTYEAYWGEVEKYVPQCGRTIFLHDDTVTYGWDSKELAQRFCDVALKDYRTGKLKVDRLVDHKIVYGHSMGCATTLAAFKYGTCEEGKNVTLVTVEGPFKGSACVPVLVKACAEGEGFSHIIYHELAKLLAYCQGTKVYPAYYTLQPSYSGLEFLVESGDQYIDGVMCGTSAFGLNTLDSVPLEALSTIVGYQSPDDGMVEVNSCDVLEKSILSVREKINHADGTCRHGNGWYGGEARKPCDFYSRFE